MPELGVRVDFSCLLVDDAIYHVVLNDETFVDAMEGDDDGLLFVVGVHITKLCVQVVVLRSSEDFLYYKYLCGGPSGSWLFADCNL